MADINQTNQSRFTHFKESTDSIELPARFTFPFYYDPHPLCISAAKQLQDYLKTQTEWEYDFGIKNPDSEGAMGKMFGVLIVKNEAGEMGFISAFSGKMLNKNKLGRFAPAIFDTVPGGEFYTAGEKVLNVMTNEIARLENNPELPILQELVKKEKALIDAQLTDLKAENQAAKRVRKARREVAKESLFPQEYAELEKELALESVTKKYILKDTERRLSEELSVNKDKLDILENEIKNLRDKRRATSVDLQQKLFQHYRFLNIEGKRKDLTDIFKDIPVSSGAGECAAPKLLQYAFMNKMTPIAMAEFWWGKPPASAVRYHGHYYPACSGKCKPILAHMLDGMDVDENPMLTNPALGKELPTVFEDEHIVIVNKPAEFLSVPGKNIHDSVQTRMLAKYPDATGPMIVHRLDMSTSGILLLAKTKENYKFLQRQFTRRRVKKRYVAWLEGVVEGESGTIELPLRVDLDDRPHQIICYEHGRNAKTEWEVIERTDTRTKVYFYPVTGRTHQLRVHAAHARGLGCPIIGDDLYGVKGLRLHLHAERLEFEHPVTRERVVIEVEAGF
ncbi:MAG: tRNA pseudouridine32 synthase/23S rRNA pseudouridine746 synthase [Saprospiraceae bacterium]|jgi:tRNA pseudouridine32 synthase/23S rRNA pseudouridine746 synthase